MLSPGNLKVNEGTEDCIARAGHSDFQTPAIN